MKKTLILLALVATFSLAMTGVLAEHRNVEYGASWTFGRNWTRVYADNSLVSSVAWKTTTITFQNNSANSGSIPPDQAQAFCNLRMNPWEKGEQYYYNVWQ